MDLSSNDIGGYRSHQGPTPEGPKAIADALLVNTKLTKCKLRNNKIGVEGWTIIFEALCDSPSSKITEWDLSGENLGHAISTPLAEYLSITTSLTSVRASPSNESKRSQIRSLLPFLTPCPRFMLPHSCAAQLMEKQNWRGGYEAIG